MHMHIGMMSPCVHTTFIFHRMGAHVCVCVCVFVAVLYRMYTIDFPRWNPLQSVSLPHIIGPNLPTLLSQVQHVIRSCPLPSALALVF